MQNAIVAVCTPMWRSLVGTSPGWFSARKLLLNNGLTPQPPIAGGRGSPQSPSSAEHVTAVREEALWGFCAIRTKKSLAQNAGAFPRLEAIASKPISRSGIFTAGCAIFVRRRALLARFAEEMVARQHRHSMARLHSPPTALGARSMCSGQFRNR